MFTISNEERQIISIPLTPRSKKIMLARYESLLAQYKDGDELSKEEVDVILDMRHLVYFGKEIKLPNNPLVSVKISGRSPKSSAN